MINNTKNLLLIVSLFFLFTQYLFLIPKENHINLDDAKIVGGDKAYYLDGAKSILEYDAIKKFNDKKQPISENRVVKSEDLPNYASIVSFAYPNSSFKFGYSLTIAIFTGLLPDHIFEKIVPRLAFTNFLLSLSSLLLLVLIVKKYTNSIAIPLCISAFYCLDTFNINNNYIYQSHTISGIFYSLLAIYVYLNFNRNNFIFFILGNLICLSLLSSSHLLPFNAILASLIFLFSYQETKIIFSKKIIYFVYGSIFWLVYIFFVEWYVNFNELGIPTWINQNLSYSGAVKSLISTYALIDRQIWHLEIWNIFLVIISILLFFGFLSSKAFNFINLKAKIKDRNFLFVFIPSIIFIITTSIVSQPILRAMVPNLILLDIFLGIIAGILIDKNKYLFIISYSVIFLLFINYLIYVKVNVFENGKHYYSMHDLTSKQSRVSHILTDNEIIWKKVDLFFKDPTKKIEDGKLGIYSQSLKNYFNDNQKKIDNECLKDDYLVEIHPMDIIINYSHTRRFIPAFQPNKNNIVNSQTIVKDFKLFDDLLTQVKLGNIKIYEKQIIYWHPTFFDQEYNYIYGYKGKIKNIIKDTNFNFFDFRKIYFLDLCQINHKSNFFVK